MKRKKIAKNFGVGLLFTILIVMGFIVQLCYPDSAYSRSENRALTTLPSFSVSAFQQKDFQTNFEDYENDQFPNRSNWMQMKTRLDLLLGVRQIQDVYVGSNDMLIQKVDYSTSDTTLQAKADSINAFKAKYSDVNFNMMLVPNKIEIYKENLPAQASSINQSEVYTNFTSKLDESIQKVDTFSILNEHKEEYLYYNSDHHWTTLAAKYVADAFLGKDEIAYNVVTSNDQFYGTLANKIAYYTQPDTISLYLPQEEGVQYVVDYQDGTKAASLYDASKQFDSDAYAVYFGGNHPIMEINTTSTENKRLLIFKDSYANCLIPFLIPYYSKIVVVDPRYYYGDVNTIMQEEAISDVLYLYNINTFFSDDSLLNIK